MPEIGKKSIEAIVLAVTLLILSAGCDRSEEQKSIPDKNSTEGPSGIEVVESIYEFGKVQRGAKVAHTFVVKNTGDTKREILKVNSRCDCTVADVSSKEIQPGEESRIHLVLETAGMSGTVMRSVDIETDDPLQDRFTLTMKGEVNLDTGFEKVGVGIAKARLGETYVRTNPIKVKNPEKVRFAEPVVTIDGGGLSARVVERKTKEGEISHLLELIFKPQKVGEVVGRITLDILEPQKDQIVTVLRADVLGPIIARPSKILLWTGQTKGKGDSVVLKSKLGSFRLTGIKEESGRISAKQSSIHEGKEYRISIQLSDKGLKSDVGFFTTLVVSTDRPDQPTIEIPVRYQLREKDGLRTRIR